MPHDTQRSKQYIQNKSFKKWVSTRLKYKVKVPGKSIPHRDRNATLSPNTQILGKWKKLSVIIERCQ